MGTGAGTERILMGNASARQFRIECCEDGARYPRKSPMTIEFICPNGHQLSAPVHLAGKASKCPKCGSKFLVPTLDELSEAGDSSESITQLATRPGPQVTAGSDGGSHVTSDSGARTATTAAATPAPSVGGSGTSAASKSDAKRRAPAPLPPGMFVFLCPNNHKLNGPVSLKGKPGQCPHCGAKFRIPADDDQDEPSAAQSTALTETTRSSLPISADRTPNPEGATVPADIPFESDEIPTVEPISIWQLPPPPPGHGNRLAELFNWVWSQREARSVVELIFKDGSVMTPKWFAPELSVDGYGALAVQDEYGRYTLTFVPWDSIQQLSVRNLDEIPPQFR